MILFQTIPSTTVILLLLAASGAITFGESVQEETHPRASAPDADDTSHIMGQQQKTLKSSAALQSLNQKNLEENVNVLLNNTETLPVPQPQTGPQLRNYVAYIPVPINDEEEEDEDEEYYEDEYEDEDEEYYEDDEYEYEEEEEIKPKRRRKPTRRPSPTRRRPTRRRYSANTKDGTNENDSERIPFLVPLMMVPESEIGIDKQFSFSGDQLSPPNNQRGNNGFNGQNNNNNNNNFQERFNNVNHNRRRNNRPLNRPQSMFCSNSENLNQ
jgi:hypothetical protein